MLLQLYFTLGMLVMGSLCDLAKEFLATKYEALIAKATLQSSLYHLNKDASRYRPDNEDVNDFGVYDFVIVGGGTSGSVVASRLSEVPNATVLVLEAGVEPNEVTDIPALGWHALKSDYNWGFYTKPQTSCCLGFQEKRCPYPRGRGLGGSSLVNANMMMRGSREDYAKWGLPNWTYDDVLPYYKKSEDFHDNKPYAPVDWPYHGIGNPMSVGFNSINNTRTRAFLNAHLELNIPITDYNGLNETGASPIQVNIRNGKRCDTGTAYILPNRDRGNLKVMTKSYVTKLDISKDTKTAQGVFFTFEKKLYYVAATKEVVLSAGAFQSPQLLMLSGIGPKQHLQEMGIETIVDLEVGVLQDHSNIPMFFNHNATDQVITIQRKDALDYTEQKGTLTTFNSVSCLTVLSTQVPETKKNIDLEITLMPSMNLEIPSLQNDVMRFTVTTLAGLTIPTILQPKFLSYMIHMRPKSRGTVRLQSNDPFLYPEIDSRLFTEQEDLDAMYQILQVLKRLLDTEAFKKIDGRIALPNFPKCLPHGLDSKDYWICVFREIGFPSFHPSGTCRIGANATEGAVVDEELRVHGVKNMRVADASIFPFPMRNHPMATCIMIGERLADMLKMEHKLV